jgi:glycerol-3-phosphate cytidylyltransferase
MDVATLGTFDGMHPGHIGLLETCSRMGNVAVGVNTDEFVQQFKHVTPIFTLAERMRMVAGCRYVASVHINHAEGQGALIKQMLPTGGVFVTGSDWASKDHLAQLGLADDRDFFARNRIEVLYVDRTGEWSTTELRTRLR